MRLDNELVIRPKRPKGEDGYRTFSVRLRNEMVDRMDEIARETGHSRNELIGIFLDYALEHCRLERSEDLVPL